MDARTPTSEATRILGERLRESRTGLGLTQYEVAHSSAADLANYGKLERGIGNPTLVTLLRLFVTLDLPVHDALDGLADRDLLPADVHPFTVSEFRRAQERRKRRD
ncbi:helix-turn-helix domain-containing protein [Leifsonia shinshuensis]|uniref:helix-turn-helix domain-containing protein n=1 Tax=Leifsonia shinshuensis TaxID=150026 RepID=UPI001F50A6F3|nr:helix-turn-helix transcriptional regulator [Leifsonia shinshuensis]MCI0159130.1 helix-turn-helix domain-containing protein [Leifsonia shinshuensis]